MILCRVEDTARKYNMFPEGCTVLCGVSGGADSMAMLCALLALRDRLSVKELVCAHFNHRLRGQESDRDEAFVREFCRSREIAFMCSGADVRNEAEQSGEGIEEAARRLRYAFFMKAAEDIGAQRIATAHTADDNAETVLINLARGSGMGGLSGIPPVRGNIVRPLIRVSRVEVIAYLTSAGVEHVEDSTNADTVYFRNLVRSAVIPALKSRNPSFLQSVSSMTDLMRRDMEFLKLQAESAYASIACKTADVVLLDLLALSKLHPSLASYVCRLAYERTGGKIGELTGSHVEKLLALACGDKPSGRLSLPCGIGARREYGRLYLEKSTRETRPFSPFLLRDGLDMDIEASGFHISARKAGETEIFNNSLNTFYINYDIILNGIFVRPRKEGDRFRLPGRGISKSLKKLFIEAKIPASRRTSIPVLSFGQEVAAVAGFGLDERFRAGTGGVALRVEFS